MGFRKATPEQKKSSMSKVTKLTGKLGGLFRKAFLGSVEEDVAINNMPIKDMIDVIKESEQYLAKERGLLLSIPCREFCGAAAVSMSAGFCCSCIPPVLGPRSLGLNTHFATPNPLAGGTAIKCASITKVTMEEMDFKDEAVPETAKAFQNAAPMKLMMRATQRVAWSMYTLDMWSSNWFFPINLITIPITVISIVVGFMVSLPLYACACMVMPFICLDMAIQEYKGDAGAKTTKMLRVTIHHGRGYTHTMMAFPKSEWQAVRRIFNFDIKADKKTPYPAPFWDKFLEGQDLAAIDAKVPKTKAGVIAEQNAVLKTAAQAEVDKLKAQAQDKVQAEVDSVKAQAQAEVDKLKAQAEEVVQEEVNKLKAQAEDALQAEVDKLSLPAQEKLNAEVHLNMSTVKGQAKAKARAEAAESWERAKAQCAPLLAKAGENLDLKYAYAGMEIAADAMGAYDTAMGKCSSAMGKYTSATGAINNEMDRMEGEINNKIDEVQAANLAFVNAAVTDLGGDAEEPAEPEDAADTAEDGEGEAGATWVTKVLQPLLNVLSAYSKPKNKLDLVYETKCAASGFHVVGDKFLQKEIGRYAVYVAVSPRGEHYLILDPKKQYQAWTKHSLRGLRAFNAAGGGKAGVKARKATITASYAADKFSGASKIAVKAGAKAAVTMVTPGDPFGLSKVINAAIDFDVDTMPDLLQFIPNMPKFHDLPFFDLLRVKRGFKDILAEKCGKMVVDVGEDEMPEEEDGKGKGKGKNGKAKPKTKAEKAKAKEDAKAEKRKEFEDLKAANAKAIAEKRKELEDLKAANAKAKEDAKAKKGKKGKGTDNCEYPPVVDAV